MSDELSRLRTIVRELDRRMIEATKERDEARASLAEAVAALRMVRTDERLSDHADSIVDALLAKHGNEI